LNGRNRLKGGSFPIKKKRSCKTLITKKNKIKKIRATCTKKKYIGVVCFSRKVKN
jgi:hypothetical protein